MKLISSNIIGQGSKDLIVLHGFLGMGDNWKSFAKKFSNIGYKVHLIDQRNHGRSFWDEEFNYQVLAKDLYYYIEYHNINNPIVLGHSMGGKTAMKFSFDFPEIIKKLIIVDIVPKKYKNSDIDILKGLALLDFDELRTRNSVDSELSKFVKEISIRQFLLKNLYWSSKEKLALRLNIDVLKDKVTEVSDFSDIINQYKGNSLFLFGEKSEYYSKNDEITVRNFFPNSKISIIRNASHWLHIENPNDFINEITSWI
tara:strand:+ start:1095 stop:1862 length:768 start_codon:yes stop_codon:yes gene_type:complete